jgi:hypothetical protein
MSTQAPAHNDLNSGCQAFRLPPEDQFWKRYSPHHELPLSTASSLMLHGVVLALLILGGIVLARFGFRDNNVEVSAVQVVGTGTGTDANAGARTGEEHEAVQPQDNRPEKDIQVGPSPNLKAPTVKPESILPSAATGDRPFQAEDNAKQLASLSESLRRKLEGAVTGSQDGKGQRGKKVLDRKERQQRWVMTFNTKDGDDYARQLNSLKAILAIPDPKSKEGQFLAVEDLAQRPAKVKAKDLTKLDRIYWIDDKPESVKSLATALRLDPVPKYIVAFFPKELEKDLLAKELNYQKTPEDQIKETHFHVQRTPAGDYEAVVSKQFKKQ